jgi:hypothetical protein
VEIIEILADHFSNISSNSNYSSEFLAYKQEEENKPLNIPPSYNEHYNANFTLKELHNALNECK